MAGVAMPGSRASCPAASISSLRSVMVLGSAARRDSGQGARSGGDADTPEVRLRQ